MNPSSPRTSPAHAPARIARNAVETVLFSLREIPLSFDRPAVGGRLQSAMQYLYTTLDSDADSPAHLEGLSLGADVLSEAHGLLSRAGDAAAVPSLGRALTILGNAITHCRSAAEEVVQYQVQVRLQLRRAVVDDGIPKPRPFRASLGVPQLHAILRQPLAPHVPLDPIVPVSTEVPLAPPPPQPRPKTMDELEAFAAAATADDYAAKLLEPDSAEPSVPPPAPEYAYRPSLEEGASIRALARDALEDIANLSTLRHPIPTETWLDQAPFEQRLLNNLDFFASLGGVGLPLVSLFHAEAEKPDPARGFAVAFVLGCIDGSDTVNAATATLKLSAPEEHPGFVDGFVLAPNPAIDGALNELLGSPKPAIAGVALDALARRRTLSADAPEWILSRTDAPELAVRLARALGSNLPKERAVSILQQLLREEGPDDLFLACAESLLRRGHARVRAALRNALERGDSGRAPTAAWLLCLSGGPRDVSLLTEFAMAHASPSVARGLGRLGHADALPALIHLLKQDNEAIAEAAAEALERITGAGLHEDVDEPWELALPPEAREISELPKPTRRVRKIVRDPSRWEAWLEEHRGELDRNKKLRGGRPFVPVHIVDELDAKETPPARREEALAELTMTTGIVTSFSPSDWVARQQRMLKELREEVFSLALPAGSWCFAGAPLGLHDMDLLERGSR